MITVKDIYKSFGKVRAVRGVSFDAPDGKITGLLGPNGAGKSTTLRILYTVLEPDEGQVVTGSKQVQVEQHAIDTHPAQTNQRAADQVQPHVAAE